MKHIYRQNERLMKIFIVVLNWNGKKLTLNCLDSLRKTIGKREDVFLVLVDNNSSDDSVRVFRKLRFPFKFHLIVNKKNIGWSGGHNVGIKYALENGASAILLLANDAIVTKGVVDNLKLVLFSDVSIGIVSPKIYHLGTNEQPLIYNAGNILNKFTYRGKDLGNGEMDLGQYNSVFETDYVTGTAITVKREVFEKIGFFDDNFFLYYEDVDFCYRAKKIGYKCVFAQKAIIYHKGAATTRVGSPLHTYYNSRNRLLFLEKHAPLYIQIKEYIFLFPKIANFLIRRNKEWKKYFVLGVRDYFLRRFGERSYW